METSRREFIALGGSALLGAALPHPARAKTASKTDVCVYGGTAGGVVAAVAAAQEGCRVLLVEPSRWLGGMTGGGLSNIDWGRREAVGGLALQILKDGQDDPHYREVFNGLVKQHNITVLYEHRVAAVNRNNANIRSITLDFAPPDRVGCPAPKAKQPSALTVLARVFIDCSYEGDLMAKAGVSYTFGRESREHYGESLAGARPNLVEYDIDPYVKRGDPASGLLPLLQDRKIGPVGSADKLTMAYGFRWKFSTDAANQLPIALPEDYDPRTFEVYRRGFQSGVDMLRGRVMRKLNEYSQASGTFYKPGAGNLSRCLLTPTVFGCNAEYPDGDWPTRARVWKFHQEFLRGITHFFRTDSVVPTGLKKQALTMGFMPGIFDETGGWPQQLYVREARRMKSAYVLTQKDLEGTTDVGDSVGLASYGVDDWPYATIAVDGKVALSGGEFSMLYLDEKHQGIYKIPYRSITPLKKECDNLLVPVCCSASHIAMTSIRMEPVWMILGESAGVAASLAIKSHISVQDVNYRRLQSTLLQRGQKLERPDPKAISEG
jgi:hypothetical protein